MQGPSFLNVLKILDVPQAVAKLKDEFDGEIYVHGSCQLVQALLDAGLVDELRLMVFPVVLGTGKVLDELSLLREIALR